MICYFAPNLVVDHDFHIYIYICSFHFPSLSLPIAIPKVHYQNPQVPSCSIHFPYENRWKSIQIIIFPSKIAIFQGPNLAFLWRSQAHSGPPKRARSSDTETNSKEPTWKERPLTWRALTLAPGEVSPPKLWWISLGIQYLEMDFHDFNMGIFQHGDFMVIFENLRLNIGI